MKIRYPKINELKDLRNLLLIGFYNKFSFLFKEDPKIGEKIYNEYFLSHYKPKDLKTILVAIQNNKIVGMIQIHTRLKIDSIISIKKFPSLFLTLWRNYGFFKTFKKIFVISFMNIDNSKKKSAYISSFTVNLNVRNQGIGKKLLNAAEQLAKKRNCRFFTLHVIFNNIIALNLYLKNGFVIHSSQKSSLLKYFSGIDGRYFMKKEIYN